jgi:hypothetical protein
MTMPGGFVTERNKIVKLANAAAAGTTPVVSSIVDCSGFREITIFTDMPTDAANNFFSIQQGNTLAGSPVNTDGVISGATALAQDVAGSRVDATNNQDGIARNMKVTSRYYQATITRGTSTATGAIWALLSDPIDLPVRQPANLILERDAAPAAGTA